MSNDNNLYPEWINTSEKLQLALFGDSLPLVSEAWLKGNSFLIRCRLASDYNTKEDIAFDVAEILTEAAQWAKIDIKPRIEAICEVMPDLRPYLEDSRVLVRRPPEGLEIIRPGKPTKL